MRIRDEDAKKVASIINDAGGTLIGRTRLQKTVCLLELAGLEDRFHFDYYHYGPYSEELAQATTLASAMGLIKEEEHRAEWGGKYSVYRTPTTLESGRSDMRRALIEKAANANAIILELAATAAYLAHTGQATPWEETSRRKPDKAEGDHLEKAKQLYKELRTISSDLPEI